MEAEQEYSRPLATAAALGASVREPERFLDKHVLLTGEMDILRTRNGRECALAALHLLPRICHNLTIAFPNACDEVSRDSREIAGRIQFGNAIRIVDGPVKLKKFDAVLSVGAMVPRGVARTVINSNGWLARVSSTGQNIEKDCSQPNPIGALAAASLGVAEVFKTLVGMRPDRGAPLPATNFSLFSYRVGDNNPGPLLPESLSGNISLMGAGAIGNAIVYLLRNLQIRGHLDIIDYQDYGSENLGTCMCIGPLDVGRPKATVLASLFESTEFARGYKELVTNCINRVAKSGQYPQVILSALDDVDSRHELQGLWPDIVIDGAIGSCECQVSCHPWLADVACLRCLFRKPTASSEHLAQIATGLRRERLAAPESVITPEDVAKAPIEKQEWLTSRLGRPVCSVWQEGMASHLSSTGISKSFRPSVPFVASMSASMVITELIRFLANWQPLLHPRFQFDVFSGPQLGQILPQGRRPDCTCVVRQRNINLVRDSRTRQSI